MVNDASSERPIFVFGKKPKSGHHQDGQTSHCIESHNALGTQLRWR
jgi:hypothetical protein